MLRLSLHPGGLAPRIVNLAEWRAHILDRLRRQVELTADPQLSALAGELAALPRPPGPPPPAGPAPIVLPLRLALPDGTERVAEGRLPGTLRRAPAGEGGFGYDPILQPEGETRTCAELTPEEKNALSHRGKSIRAFVEACLG